MLIPTSFNPRRFSSLGNFIDWISKPAKRRNRASGLGCIERLEDRTLLSAPTFDESSYQFAVVENAETPALIGVATASDPESDPLTYSIKSGDPGGLFAIDDDGNFTVEGAVDYETQTTYNVTIEVTDGTGTDTATVTVDVTDVDESPVIVTFQAEHNIGDEWDFYGTIEHADPGSVTINFGGLLAGRSVQVAADGSFVLSVTLDPEDEGLVTAQAEDLDGLLSNIAQDYVVQ